MFFHCRIESYRRHREEALIVERRMISRYIVTDPRICHGTPTFRGTRIRVSRVLEQVFSGMAWAVIVEEWQGSGSKEA
jgi:uncharacterized protein (DUF433 family)